MSMIRSFVRASAAFALAGVAVSCDHDAEVLGLPNPTDDMFRSYVAIGNSITAGYQSDGINLNTQAQSYAVLLSQQMRTRFAIPALATPGCAPPIINWQTGARLGGTAAPLCALRSSSSTTDILNNVAVPGAASTEVGAPTSAYHNTLTTLILGGKTQVARALEADPTFVSIWIGNNDVLQAAATGLVTATPTISRGITPVNTFTANYEAMTDALVAGAPNLEGGVLIGVVQTAGAPLLFPVAVLQDPAYLAGFSQAAGGTVTVHPNCTGSGALVSFAIIPQMRAFNSSTGAGHPRAIVCAKNTPGFPAPIGDIFILDAEDQQALGAAVTAYNDFIEAKATELNFAYYDPNDLLGAQRAPGGCIALFPNLLADATTGAPFGTCISYDGVHPSAAGHRMIANALIAAINNEYPEASLTALP
jgi:lysophospholipase L1-like esterase